MCGLFCVFAVLVRVMILVCNVFVCLGCDLLCDDVWCVCLFIFVVCHVCVL